MPDAVLVIDMLRGFMEEGCSLYCGDRARRIIPTIQNLLKQETSRGSRVFFLCDSHDPDDLEFKMFPPHCVAGTPESEVVPELAVYGGEIIRKKTYSSFSGTGLEQKLKKLKPEKVIVCGVCTDICIRYAVSDLHLLNYYVEVPVDCVASFDEKAHQAALEHIEKVLGAKLTLSTGKEMIRTKFPPAPEVITGGTADVYFARTMEILKKENLNPVATIEIFARHDGVLCGIKEVKALLAEVLPEHNREVWAMADGDDIAVKEVVARITAPYRSYGLYETAMLGMLAHGTGWATAARECVEAAKGIPVIGFGARHVHPSVAAKMDYAAVVGGFKGCSSIDGAKLAGLEPSGTMPHALVLVVGDTVKATLMFDKHMPPGVPRVSLVDTFMDEDKESLRVAEALKGRLQAVRLDTPGELGGVTVELVKRVRARLDESGFNKVGIFVSGGFTPERIKEFIAAGAPVTGFGVGSYVSGAGPIDFTADLHEVDGKPIAKRGRTPGITPNPRLQRIL